MSGLFVWAGVATVWLLFLVSRLQQGLQCHCPTPEPLASATEVALARSNERSAMPVASTAKAEEHESPEVESEVVQQTVVDKQTPFVLQKYYSELFRHVEIDYENERCTLVMLTYKRIGTLPELLTHYCKVQYLENILVIWNDVGTPVPQNLLDLSKSCETKLQFIREKENRLSNRFKPRPEIETECKC